MQAVPIMIVWGSHSAFVRVALGLWALGGASGFLASPCHGTRTTMAPRLPIDLHAGRCRLRGTETAHASLPDTGALPESVAGRDDGRGRDVAGSDERRGRRGALVAAVSAASAVAAARAPAVHAERARTMGSASDTMTIPLQACGGSYCLQYKIDNRGCETWLDRARLRARCMMSASLSITPHRRR